MASSMLSRSNLDKQSLPKKVPHYVSLDTGNEALRARYFRICPINQTEYCHRWDQLADIDVVLPIPERAKTPASSVADRLKKPYCQGFVKNRYVFGTFIMPGQKTRKKSVRRKLNLMKVEFDGQNVLFVDDNIVCGITSHEIADMA
ncbi:amidophosphoribosyltransferase [Schaereria dolodes]|nr:amidophosphoribosyltransferase [Schaereria dolodes]